MKLRKQVVVIGGGFGGLAATRALAREAVQVTLVDRRNHGLTVGTLYYLIDFSNRVFVIISWAWSYLTYRRGARLITGRDRRGERT